MLAVALGAAALGPQAVAAQEVGLAVGTRAPAVQVEDLDGKVVDLGQYIGKKPVVMEFWAAWCTVCEALQPRMEAAERRYGSQAEFLTVAVGVNQSVRSIRRHLERHPVPGQMLFDKDGRATRAYEAPATSYVVVLDREGRVAYTGIGEDQDLMGVLGRVVGQ